MENLIRRYKDTKLSKNFTVIDNTTGELAALDGNVLIRKPTGKINVNYSAFLYLNLQSLTKILSKGITQVQLGLLISISSNLLINENICMQDNDEPHTAESIGKIIGNTKQAAKIKLNSLIKLDLLSYSKTRIGLKFKKVYRINPFLLKRGIDLKDDLAELFNPIL